MGKRFQLTESEIEQIKNLYSLNEEEKDSKKFCHGGNTKELSEIVGDDEDEDYIEGVKLRKNGVNGMIDRLELLKTLRLHPNVSDGGEHLAYDIMNKVKGLRPYNYFDETTKECSKVMDKIIELYKENEHGEELVKDIEKVYAMKHLSPRAKEFLKHTIGMIKGN
jgi:hypothetical protein